MQQAFMLVFLPVIGPGATTRFRFIGEENARNKVSVNQHKNKYNKKEKENKNMHLALMLKSFASEESGTM